jgi:pyruvate kinase
MVSTTDQMFDVGSSAAKNCGFLSDGDLIVMTGGTPVGMSGTTNTIKVQSIGHSIVQGKGQPAGEGTPTIVYGTVMIIRDPEHLEKYSISSSEDIILVAPYTNNHMMPLIRKARALVVEDDDPVSHTAAVAMALEVPAVLSCENATRLLKDGSTVMVDAERGIVS